MKGHLIQDLRVAFRLLAHAPRFTVPAVLALALGMGATASVFSVVRGVMLKPLPYREPGPNRLDLGNEREPQPDAWHRRGCQLRRVAGAE